MNKLVTLQCIMLYIHKNDNPKWHLYYDLRKEPETKTLCREQFSTEYFHSGNHILNGLEGRCLHKVCTIWSSHDTLWG